MSEPDRETRDLLIAISTKLDVVIGRQDDQESRIRDIYQRLATCVTGEDLRTQRRQVVTMVTVCVAVVGGIVGLVTALT